MQRGHIPTPTAVKAAKMTPRIRHSKENPASNTWDCVLDPATPCQPTICRNPAVPSEDSQRSRDTARQNVSIASVTLAAHRPLREPSVGSTCCSLCCLTNALPTPSSYRTLLILLLQAFASGADGTSGRRFLSAISYLFCTGCMALICYS